MRDKDQRRKLRKQKEASRKANYVPKHFVGVVGWTKPDLNHVLNFEAKRRQVALEMDLATSFIGTSHAACEQVVKTAIASLPNAIFPSVSPHTTCNNRRCWVTVREAVNQYGGRPIAGWSVVDIAPKLPQKNPLARVVLNSHCVWEFEGQLLETVLERQGLAFIPATVPTPDATIEFYDSVAAAKHVLPTMSFDHKGYHYAFVVVTLTNTPPLHSFSDPKKGQNHV